MSDLQCPSRILVARHGEATYEGGDVITDAGGQLSETGVGQARALAERLSGERVAAVYASRLDRAQQTAAIVGDRLGLPVTVVAGVEELRVGSLEGVAWTAPEAQTAVTTVSAWAGGDLNRRWPGAESGVEVVGRFVAALAELADRHRGETVVVVSHGGVMTLGITHTAVNVAPQLRTKLDLPHTAVATVEIDADGWRLVGPWPGRAWSPEPDRSEQTGPDVVDAP
ncbi:MAG: histidine phosphatase family protein [Lapillicoccus sp.]